MLCKPVIPRENLMNRSKHVVNKSTALGYKFDHAMLSGKVERSLAFFNRCEETLPQNVNAAIFGKLDVVGTGHNRD